MLLNTQGESGEIGAFVVQTYTTGAERGELLK